MDITQTHLIIDLCTSAMSPLSAIAAVVASLSAIAAVVASHPQGVHTQHPMTIKLAITRAILSRREAES